MGEKLNKTSLGIVFLFVLFSLAAALFYLEKPTGTVIGVVVGTDNQPIAKATVMIDNYPRNRKVVTDAEGKFRFDLVPVGKYYLSVNAKGYQANYISHEQEVKEGQLLDLKSISLKELDPNLSVSVWNSTKTPDEKVTLSIYGAKVRQIHFAAYRVDLVKYLSQGGRFQDLEKPESDPARFAGLEVAREWDETLPEEEVPQFDRKVPADLKDGGLYLIHSLASSTDRKQVFTHNVLVNKTDLGFVVRRDESRLLVYASSFLKPQPVSGAKVLLFISEEADVPASAEGAPAAPNAPRAPLQESSTNPQGVADFNLPASSTPPGQKVLAVMMNGGNTAFSWVPTLSSGEEEGDEGEGEGGVEGEGEGEGGEEGAAAQPAGPPKHYRAFLYTERPIYRTGQKVYFKGILRTENDNGQYEMAPPQDVPITINNPKGDPIFEGTLKSNAFGSFWGEFDIEEEGDLGLYTLVANVGGKEFRKDFDVDEYRKPEFKVEIQPDKPRYFSGDKITFAVDTQYYSGVPVEAHLEYTVYKSAYDPVYSSEDRPSYFMGEEEYAGGYGEVVEDGKIDTDAKGHAVITVQSAKSEEDERYTLRITAKDLTEKQVTTENDALVTAGDFYFKTERTEFLATPKKPFPITVQSFDYEGKPVSRDYEMTVEREKGILSPANTTIKKWPPYGKTDAAAVAPRATTRKRAGTTA
ncbi:MAG: MG2 domain-containing protein [bacterium]